MSPPQIIAHYRMIAKIGEGGMGEVYRALDTKLCREVASAPITVVTNWLCRAGTMMVPTATTTIGFGIVLIVVGLAGYFGTNMVSITALIPG